MILSQIPLDLGSLLLLGLGIVVAYIVLRALLGGGPPPFAKKPSLMSNEEQEFYHVLYGVAEGKWSVFAMVRMADLLEVRSHVPRPHFWKKQIAQEHLDFLLCDSDSLEPVLAIELDPPESAPKQPDDQEHELFVNDALAAAGLPILRVKPQEKYSTSELRQTIYHALGIDRRSSR